MRGDASDGRAVAVEVRPEALRVYHTGETLGCLCICFVARQSAVGIQADGGCDG